MILHSDINCFYAAVECFVRLELRDKPVVVGGNEEARGGIVLAKNLLAKAAGIKTGDVLWEARNKCPGLVVVPPNYQLYMHYSKEARRIYYDYSDQVEPFGPDEAWIDITGTVSAYGGREIGAAMIAQEISERTKSELGISVSIGVSWNKVFAKFGSDYKKPDAITAITPDNYKSLVWSAPVEDLLYVGPATKRKLNGRGVLTIGDLANYSPRAIASGLGKVGTIIQAFARGEDATPVKILDPKRSSVDYVVKSIGNGLTAPRDLKTPSDVKALTFLLAESVAARLREHKLKAKTIGVGVRDSDLVSYTRQRRLIMPSNLTTELAQAAFKLICDNEDFREGRALRSLRIRAQDLAPSNNPSQTNLFVPEPKRMKLEALESSVDDLRSRFGNKTLVRGIELIDRSMADVDIKEDNVIHPVGYFR